MADIGKPGSPQSVTAPRGEWVVLTFATTGAATPALATNGNLDGVIDSDVAAVDNGAGDHTWSLRERWAYLHPLPGNVVATTGNYNASIIVDTSVNPQTVQLLVYDTDATAALADPSATVYWTILARRNTNTG